MLKELWRAAVKAMQRLEVAGSGLAALMRRRNGYIVERLPGIGGEALDGKVCVFAHYDRKGEVHDYVLHYLKALRAAGFKIVFVSNAPALLPPGAAEVSALAHLVLRRSQAGRYFGAYKDGIAALGDLSGIDQLLLANDRLYGPFFPLGEIFHRMSVLPGQFWSLTDSWERAYHLDADFILFGREAIASAAFRKFWAGVRYAGSRHYIFRYYEVGLSQALIGAGLRGTALCSYRDASRAVIDAVRAGALEDERMDDDRKQHLRHVYGLLQRGRPFNISAYLWDYLIAVMGYPFIDSNLFHKSDVTAPYISHWQRVLARESSYDPDLIVRHLETTLKNRFT